MTRIYFDDTDYPVNPGETVLETLTAAGKEIPNACRSGVCQSCLMQAKAGEIPPAAQQGLKDTLRASGHFLACQCQPIADMEVVVAGEAAAEEIPVELADIEWLSPSVMRVLLEPKQPFEYKRGQFINLIREDGVRRSYSLAGGEPGNPMLELHIRHIPGGRMSDWLVRRPERQPLHIQGPLGSCFYTDKQVGQPLLLIGTGTGLAPLYGIVNDALMAGHTGPIHLYHGARKAEELYLVDQLRALADQYANLHYTPCVLEPSDKPSSAQWATGRVDEIGFSRHGNLKGWRCYFCGNPDLVTRLRKQAYLGGASLKEIHADAFLPAANTA